MQGRLSAQVEGKIQAFPWNEWREEFPRAHALGLTRIEWTIDQDRLRENPLNTAAGQQEILELSRRHALRPASLTGDCFMQAPFWKADGETQKSLVDDLDLVLASCSTLGIEFVVMPLVDNGRIESTAQAETLLRVLNVHVKDRLLGGTTVPLGMGAADLAKTIRLIEQSGYRGQYILQTARA